MAAFALTATNIYAGALDASCFGNTVDLTVDGETVDATTFCSGGWRVMIPGLETWSASFGGPQDFAASTAANTLTPDEHYQLTVGSSYPLLFVPDGGAVGSVAYASNGQLNMYVPLTGSIGDLAEHNTSWGPATTGQPLVRGVYATSQTVTATGNSTSGHQLGAVSATQRVYGGVHFLTAGGTTPSITVILESDDSNAFSSATTRATFTAATARGAQWTSVAGAITDDWWRFRWTVSGTGPSFQVRGFIGIQ